MEEKRARYNWPEIYRKRRNVVREKMGDVCALWLGHSPQVRNNEGNAYPFRQNSHFLYYTGLSVPNLAVLSFPEAGHDVLFADSANIDEVIWSGPGRSTNDLARDAGIETVEEFVRLGDYVEGARKRGLKIHYLPPYRASSLYRLSRLLKTTPKKIIADVSQTLMEAVAGQRSVKSEEEIDQIEEALTLADRMHRACMAAARPGLRESELAGLVQSIALCRDRPQAFAPIVTVRGEVLHNNSYDGILKGGQLLLNDSGVESSLGYASDITRTFPVDGRFSNVQAAMYQIVLDVQLGAIEKVKPGVTYREVHMDACRILVERLADLGLMKGDPAEAVGAGAHALFLPHGIGHMMGLDVHDMEDLGNIVGYKKNETRSSQFGLKYLRLSRPLEPGFVLTVEPGVYFIPALIDQWKSEKRHAGFINYDMVEWYRGFGGIRIEDNILVTSKGMRELGPGIPRTIREVEDACGRSIQGGWPPALL